MTENSLNVVITVILGLEALLLVLCVPALLYVGQQVDRLKAEKQGWIQQLRMRRHQVAEAKKGVHQINLTAKTVLPAALASGPWKFILPVLLRLL